MTLREWRKQQGLPLWKIAEMAKKKDARDISNFETRGIRSFRQRELFTKISKGLITNFEGEQMTDNNYNLDSYKPTPTFDEYTTHASAHGIDVGTKYTTVEGDEIKVGGFYQTREGAKVYVHYLASDCVYGQTEGEIDGGCWSIDGTASDTLEEAPDDLMRPWKAQAETPAEWIRHYGGEQPIDDGIMVEYEMSHGKIRERLSEELDWPNNQGAPQLIIAYRILPQEDKPEPKKQTLLQFMDAKYKNDPDFDRRFYTQCLSEYLEERGL